MVVRAKTARRSSTRRQFVRGLSAMQAGLALPFVARRSVLGANGRLNVAAIGAGGVGADDIGFCSGENVVALCDVDQRAAAASFSFRCWARAAEAVYVRG